LDQPEGIDWAKAKKGFYFLLW